MSVATPSEDIQLLRRERHRQCAVQATHHCPDCAHPPEVHIWGEGEGGGKKAGRGDQGVHCYCMAGCSAPALCIYAQYRQLPLVARTNVRAPKLAGHVFSRSGRRVVQLPVSQQLVLPPRWTPAEFSPTTSTLPHALMLLLAKVWPLPGPLSSHQMGSRLGSTLSTSCSAMNTRMACEGRVGRPGRPGQEGSVKGFGGREGFAHQLCGGIAVALGTLLAAALRPHACRQNKGRVSEGCFRGIGGRGYE